MRAAVAVALLLSSGGCESSLPRGEAVDARGRWGFELLGASTREGNDDRALWRLSDPPLTVTAQRIPREMARGERTLESIADAISERYAAGEVDGTMRTDRCTVAGGEAHCLDGWIQDEGRRLLRKGVLVAVGDDFIFLEVIGTDREAVARQAELLSNSFHERSGRGGAE